MKKNIVKEKSFSFSVCIVKLCQQLIERKREYVLSRQLLRSGTAVGALIREAEHAESKADFIHKMSISLKEANETDYWIDLMYETQYLSQKQYDHTKEEIIEIIKLLISIIRTSKTKK